MLRLGKLADYSLLITTHLVKNTLQPTTEEIAIALTIPLATVRKLMKPLVDAGIIASQRGARGGYKLARNPADINIAEVIQAVSGPIQITECCEKTFQCDKGNSCDLITNWQYLNNLLIKQFSEISVLAMAGDLQRRKI